MKKILFLYPLINFSCMLFAQNIIGSWQGSIEFSGKKLPLIFHLKGSLDNITATMDSPLQNAKEIPISSATVINNQLNLRADHIGMVYLGIIKDQKIEGKFMQSGLGFDLTLTPYTPEDTSLYNRPQTPQPPFDYPIQDLTFINPKEGNTIAGTLTLPKDKNNVPIVILLSGSGQQNRNSELFGHQPFWVIADNFATKGIATLRLDDRGIGESTAGKKDDTTENFAGDIDAAVEFLKSIGYKNIGLVGHSEGGLIASILGAKNNNIKFIVSLAGPGIAISELMYQQNKDILALTDLPKDRIENDLNSKKLIFNYLAHYKGTDINSDFNTFLITTLPALTEQERKAYSQLTQPWMLNFMKYNPSEYWSKITIPVLAINGSLDKQVDAKNNLAAIRKALQNAKNKNYKVEEIPNLNHLFQTAKTGHPNEYGEIEESISPKVLDLMSRWILTLKQ